MDLWSNQPLAPPADNFITGLEFSVDIPMWPLMGQQDVGKKTKKRTLQFFYQLKWPFCFLFPFRKSDLLSAVGQEETQAVLRGRYWGNCAEQVRLHGSPAEESGLTHVQERIQLLTAQPRIPANTQETALQVTLKFFWIKSILQMSSDSTKKCPTFWLLAPIIN